MRDTGLHYRDWVVLKGQFREYNLNFRWKFMVCRSKPYLFLILHPSYEKVELSLAPPCGHRHVILLCKPPKTVLFQFFYQQQSLIMNCILLVNSHRSNRLDQYSWCTVLRVLYSSEIKQIKTKLKEREHVWFDIRHAR